MDVFCGESPKILGHGFLERKVISSHAPSNPSKALHKLVPVL
jgi:hypothetical protein